MKTVLITGASGDVGTHLARELAGKYKLRLSDKRPLKAKNFVRADVSKMADALPGFNVSATQFVLAPAGTPAPIVNKLSEAIRTVVSSADMAQVAEKQGNIPWPLTPAQLGEAMQKES